MTTTTPAIEGWFTTGDAPALIGSRCTTCTTAYFPPVPTESFCRNPRCTGENFEASELSRRGTIWSYTDAQYQPPPPYILASDPYEAFALVAVELPEGLVVLGQAARGVSTDDLKVGASVDLVVETLYEDETGERLIWRWQPVTGADA